MIKENDNLEKILKINDIIKSRVPPNIWDLIGYCVSLYALFTRNDKIGYIIVSLSAFYFFLNFIFDHNTLMIDLNNDFSKFNLEKDYEKLTFWKKICWINKKFTCVKYSKIMNEMYKSEEINSLLNKLNSQNLTNYELEDKYMNNIQKKILKETKQDINYELNYEVHVYLDKNIWIENILFMIYFLGITKNILINKNILENYVNLYTNHDELNDCITINKNKLDEHFKQNYNIEHASYCGSFYNEKRFL